MSFKAAFYNYTDALASWSRLSALPLAHTHVDAPNTGSVALPVLLRPYLPWLASPDRFAATLGDVPANRLHRHLPPPLSCSPADYPPDALDKHRYDTATPSQRGRCG